MKNWIPVLCYHRVAPKSEWGPDSSSLCVTPEQFHFQLRLLKWLGYSTIMPQSLTAFLKAQKNLPKKPVLLSFDDGYEDNYRYALPILKKFSFRAVIFLITEALGKKNTWDSGTLSMLTEAQVQEMLLAGIEFGSHTQTHLDLSKAPEDQIRTELKNSLEKLKEITQRTDISFCYPYSRFTPQAKKLVEEAGYLCAFAGDNEFEGQDLFQLMRIQVFPKTSLFGFWKKIQPWYPAFAKLQKDRKKKKQSHITS